MTREQRARTGVSISDVDTRGVLSFDLRDILALVPEDAIDSSWQVSGAEAVGHSAEALHDASDAGVLLSHPRLCEIAADLTQTIDGELRAYRPGESEPWLVIRAVDSSGFDVISDDPTLIETVRRRFQRVREYPPSEL
jgi:hypothetical protein